MEILYMHNLSEKYENSELGLLYKGLNEEKLYKAEVFDFQKIKKVLKFKDEKLILTKDGSLYYGVEKIKALENKKITDIEVSYGFNFAFAITKDKKIYAWGENEYGQLGVGDFTYRDSPVQVSDLDGFDIAQLEAGAYHVALLTNNKQIYTWGYNKWGQLGLGDSQNRTTPQKVEALSSLSIMSLAVGGSHTLALTELGAVYSWGFDAVGQLGHERRKKIDVTIPSHIRGLSNEVVIRITAGASHSFALTINGDVYVWGFNSSGQLGTRGVDCDNKPILLKDLKDKRVTQIRAVHSSSFALTDKNNVYAWGNNKEFQLGLRDCENRNRPVLVPNLKLKSLY